MRSEAEIEKTIRGLEELMEEIEQPDGSHVNFNNWRIAYNSREILKWTLNRPHNFMLNLLRNPE